MRGALVVALVIAVAAAVPASAQQLPVPEVQLPSAPVELPSLPVPAPAPPPVDLPAAPVPLPVPVPGAVTDAVQAPVQGEAPARALGEAVERTMEQVASGSGSAVQRAVTGRGSSSPGRDGEPRKLFGTRHRTPRSLVRALRGCVDELPPMRAQVLVLTYGLGPAARNPRARVARRLGLSRREYHVVHRRALRQLVVVSRRTDCRGSGIAASMLSHTSATGTGASSHEFALAGLSDSGGSAPGGHTEADGEVLGETARGGDGPPEAAVPGMSLPVIDDSGDLPYVIALGLLMLGLFAWVLLQRRRADASEQL